MSAFNAQRISLVSGIAKAVTPPYAAAKVTVINATGASLRLYTTPNDATAYLDITDGYSWPFELAPARGGPMDIAFYLVSSVDGTAIVLWQ